MSDAPIGGLRDGCLRGSLVAILVAVVVFVASMVLIDAMPPAQQPPNDTTQVQP